MEILYEDNHLLVVCKKPGEIVQGDKTGDLPMVEQLKYILKEKYNKPGNVFCGVVHRLDRPVGGVVIFAKTGKALSRLNEMLRRSEIHKTYLAIVEGCPAECEAELKHYITTVERTNKSYAHTNPRSDAKEARLKYKVLTKGDRYSLISVQLLTGRKHQIRVQLSKIGCPIKGDLKYGARRSNQDGSISLLAYRVEFIHPVSKQHISVSAPLPNDSIWNALKSVLILHQNMWQFV